MERSADVIRARDLFRGALRALPDTLTINRGLINLLRLSPDRQGSIGQVLERRAREQPDHPALRFEGRTWSYAEFNAWANRIAGVLRQQGVRHGDGVAILMENRAEVLACVAGTVKLGAIAGMLNHQQRGEALAHSLRLTRARVLIAGSECIEAVHSAGYGPGEHAGMRWLWDGEGHAPNGWLNLREVLPGAAATDPPETARVRLREPCFYIFTSGTTGLPKASVMSHYRWLRGMAGLGQMTLRLRRDDVLYCCLPLYHNNGLTVSWSVVLGAGATLALGRKFSASRFWDEVRESGATSFCYIGELCRYLLNRPPTPRDRDHKVRTIVGNGLRPEIWDLFQQRFGIERICEFYGASESNLAFANGFGLARTAGFCPLPFAIVEFDTDAEAPVRDARGFMHKVARGGVGLLITEVTDKAPFDGYTDAQATEAKLLRNVFKKGDCWFNTGDLVRDQGFHHIQFADRIGDTFRWKGENVATTEVEAAFSGFTGVEHAAVYGVQVPRADGRAGMAALSVAEPPTAATLAALARHLCAALPAYAVPLFLRIVGEHDTTSTFKFRKAALKQQGFDPQRISDPLYVLRDRNAGYEPLTPELYQQIVAGALRL
ncbi:MAG: long-chain-acyl-CoA synthetase [Gammaproteobacteria bacterium]